MLWSTTVSTVSPGPKPNSTPYSSPSQVGPSPFSIDFFLISSKMNNTHALDMLPHSPSNCLVAFILSGFKPNWASTWSRIAGPPGCAIHKNGVIIGYSHGKAQRYYKFHLSVSIRIMNKISKISILCFLPIFSEVT